MMNYSLLELALPLRDESRTLQLPQPVQGGRERRNVGSCLVFSQTELAETSASLALQSALTAASNGERVVVVVGGDQWSELPSAGHLMPKLSSELMKLIKLVYPSNSKELMKHFNEMSKDQDNLPGTIIVSDLHKLAGDKDDRHSRLKFIRLSAILMDFCDHIAQQNQKPSTLLVFSKLTPAQLKHLDSRLPEWFSELWRLENDRIVCESSKEKMVVNYFKQNNEYFLDSVQY